MNGRMASHFGILEVFGRLGVEATSVQKKYICNTLYPVYLA